MSTASETVDESEAEAAPRPGLVLRLKRLLAAPLLLLRRLRRPKAGTYGEEADADRGDEEDAAGSPAAPPLWRRLLPYGLVLLAGAAAGGAAIYGLSAQVVARQAAELNARQDEAMRLKGVLAGYDKLMLQTRKKLEEEQGKRAELENRLAMAQSDLLRPSQPPAGRGGGDQGASRSAAVTGKMADCTLRPGSAGATLKDCLAEFNRQ